MPEGDTLYRIAATLRPVLEATVVTLTLPRVPLHEVDMQLQTVQAFGKHLLIHFADGRVLHTHLKMTGRWYVHPIPSLADARAAPFAAGPPKWRRSAHNVVVLIESPAAVAICYHAPTVQLLAPLAARRFIAAVQTAQDVLSPSFDCAVAAAALRLHATEAVGVALLDQTIIAGIGNVYKSEGLFAAQIHPATQIEQIANATLNALMATISHMMRRNVADVDRAPTAAGVAAHTRKQAQYQYQRTTRSGCEIGKGPVAVYGRVGRNCFDCGTEIEMLRQGAQRRSSYFCPQCQPQLR